MRRRFWPLPIAHALAAVTTVGSASIAVSFQLAVARVVGRRLRPASHAPASHARQAVGLVPRAGGVGEVGHVAAGRVQHASAGDARNGRARPANDSTASWGVKLVRKIESSDSTWAAGTAADAKLACPELHLRSKMRCRNVHQLGLGLRDDDAVRRRRWRAGDRRRVVAETEVEADDVAVGLIEVVEVVAVGAVGGVTHVGQAATGELRVGRWRQSVAIPGAGAAVVGDRLQGAGGHAGAEADDEGA